MYQRWFRYSRYWIVGWFPA